MGSVRDTVHRARVLHAVLIASVLLYIACLYFLQPVQEEASRALVMGLSLAAASVAVVAASFRRRLVQPARQALQLSPGDTDALKRWYQGVVISLVICENIALIGFLLRVLGASSQVAGLFFGAGLLLMVVWTPRLDVPATS